VYLPEQLVPVLLRATRRNRPFVSAAAAEAEVRGQALRPASSAPPERLRRDVAIAVRREGSRPVYTVTPKDTEPTGHVIYTHGGGWVHEISRQHWALVAQIAAEANTTVTVPIWELLPYGTAESACGLVVRLFEAAAEQGDDVRLAGDSAGGQITLSAAQALRDRGHEDVRTVLVSPAADLTLSNPRIPGVAPTDPWLGVDGTRVLAAHWAGSLALTDPRVSPLDGDFAGLGPMLLLTGTRDVRNPDAHLVVDQARAAGVDVTLLERRGAVHVFPLLPTRSGAAARARIVTALRAG